MNIAINKIMAMMMKLLSESPDYWYITERGPNIDWEKVKSELSEILENVNEILARN